MAHSSLETGLRCLTKNRWNEDFERIQGMLIGYEEWQMDWWIAYIREQKRAHAAAEPARSRAE